MSRFSLTIVAVLGWSIAQAAVGRAEAPPEDVAGRVGMLVERLNDNDFGVREEARRRLTRLAQDATVGNEARRLIEQRFLDPKLSLEVRDSLRSLLPKTPAPAAEPAVDGTKPQMGGPAMPPAPPPPGESELDGLLDALDGETFDVRDRAERRLSAAAESPGGCGPLLDRLLTRAEQAEPSADAVRRWQSLWHTAWGTWLADAANAWHPQPPDDARLRATIERLVADEAEPSGPTWTRSHAAAERLLLLWLADEKTSAATAEALGRRLKDDLPIAAANRLEAIYGWTRPAMAAEFWMAGRHRAVQHLILGVPNQPDGAPKPSLFDHCDDKTAHCVSGNSLSVGDHPVGIFFPHPAATQNEAQFHLVNLPTPRRRLAYEFVFPLLQKTDNELDAIGERRRGPITRRTVDYYLEQKRLLTPREMYMFQFLDPTEASRFVEPYLLGIADERYDDGSPTAFGNGTLHGYFCYMMTNVGTPEAGKGVAAAIDRGRILPPTESKPYRIEWVAALNLASQAPWDGVDAWLADHLNRTDALRIDEPEVAEVGASCAALLLSRHGAEPSTFGLERHVFDDLIELENPGYRFTKPDGREKVKQWWNTERTKAKL